jgi:hypothetical protein
MGGGGAHFAGGHGFGGAHFAGSHFAYTGRFAAPVGHPGAFVGHGFVGRPGAGFAAGNAYWRGGRFWGGGYWHGVFWPHVWFSPGFAWWLPVLPLGYATFWWGGMPYYYWNNLYYTWSPAYSGYVVTDPPPAAGGATGAGTDDTGAAQYGQGAPQNQAEYEQAAPPPDASGQYSGAPLPDASQQYNGQQYNGEAQPSPPPSGGAQQPYTGAPPPPAGAGATPAGGDVFMYPRNGQSQAQSQNDRYECHSWAVNQSGFDPTNGSQQSGNPANYRRAMIACLDARGYSAR